MNRKKASGIIAIIVLMSFLIPPVQAPSVEVSPIDTEDDAFITGIGAYFGDTPFLFLKDQTQDIIIGTRFRNIAIPQGSKINNATLFVRSIYSYPAFGDVSVTIYGDDSDDSAAFNDSGSFTRTYTTALRNWNITEVNGNQWNNVSVTEIVQEIIDRVGWTNGNALSLIMLSANGIPRREFVSVDGNPAYVARLNITYAETPPSAPFQEQAGSPYNETELWTWTLNDTYRGIDIWIVENNGDNETGVPSGTQSVNWNTLDLTELTEIDSGAALTVNNATWVSISGLVAQQFNTLYNDSGAAEKLHFFVRGAVNISAITNNPPGDSHAVMSITGISSSTPVGGGGLRHGNVGDWAGIVMLVNTDNQRWLLRMEERSGVAADFASTNSGWFTESTNEIIYFEFQLKDLGASNWMRMSLYRNPNYINAFYSDIHILTEAGQGPAEFRYPQFCSSVADGTSSVTAGEMYSFIEWVPDVVIFLAYPNGTLVETTPLTDELDEFLDIEDIDEIEDIIDVLLGGAQPEDPQEEEYLVIGKFAWKLLVLVVGLIMLLGSPIAGVYYGGDTATWIKILYVMFFGLGILLQIKSM